ncbi:MAG: hypothetical protein AB7J32_11835 [Pseudonocardia sp.]
MSGTRDGVLEVVDRGSTLRFGLADLDRYHGPLAPGGVAHGFVAMLRAWPLLAPDGPPQRREIRVDTAFAGPGARDAFELVTRAVTEERYTVDPALARTDRGATLERYVFVFTHGDRSVRLEIREGFVTDEFVELAQRSGRTPDEEAHLDTLKREMADRLLAVPPEQVYDVV